MPTRANALAVMAKAPIPGLVKTRLVPPLTCDQAAELSKALLADQLEHVSALRSADLYLAFAPEHAGATLASLLPSGCRMFAQRGDDLGARMESCFAELSRRGHRNLLLIGGDLPPVPLAFFTQAFDFLAIGEPRVVLGPSRDGGYYLIGMNQPTPELFSRMTWSHDRVLAQTTGRLARLGIEFTVLPPWFDVDCPQDMDALRAIRDPAVLAGMQRSRVFLAQLRAKKFGDKIE